jgi:hypothetical protein
MKKVIVFLLMGLGIVCFAAKAYSREFKEHTSKEFVLSNEGRGGTVAIYNVSGFIKMEGYAGNKVLLEMDKTISADDDKGLERGRNEFRLGFDQKSDSIIAYIAGPFDSRPNRNSHYHNDGGDPGYGFKVDYTVKVPYDVNLCVSTVNDGAISVNKVNGSLHVNNVNEKISITNAKGPTYAHTVNGDVSVSYLTNPPEASSYQTINGNIHIGFQPDLSADLQFKSINGDFYTDFPDAQIMPASATKTQEKNGGMTVYKINRITSVRFGKGGKTFNFETINGNVYIKKQS